MTRQNCKRGIQTLQRKPIEPEPFFFSLILCCVSWQVSDERMIDRSIGCQLFCPAKASTLPLGDDWKGDCHAYQCCVHYSKQDGESRSLQIKNYVLHITSTVYRWTGLFSASSGSTTTVLASTMEKVNKLPQTNN